MWWMRSWPSSSQPGRRFAGVRELSRWVNRPDWSTILPAYARCVRITRDQKERFTVQPEAFSDPAESELYAGSATGRNCSSAGPVRWRISSRSSCR